MPYLLPPRSQKAAELIRFLESKIVSGQFHEGERLPPLRRLMNDFHLSYSSVQRGVAYLCSKGLLTKSGRDFLIGCTDGARHPKLFRRIAVYILSSRMNQSEGLYLSALYGIQKAALQAGYSVLVEPIESETGIDSRFDGDAVPLCSGIILLLEFDSFAEQYPVRLPTVGVQVVNDFGNVMSLVDIDPINTAEQAAAFFLDRGMRQARVFANTQPAYEFRAETFARIWQRRTGCAPETVMHEIDETVYDVDFTRNCGNFFTSDNLLQFYCRRYSERFPGRSLPADHCVLGVDGKRFIVPGFDVFPTVAVDWRKIGRIAFEECSALIERPGRQRRRIWIPGTLRLD